VNKTKSKEKQQKQEGTARKQNHEKEPEGDQVAKHAWFGPECHTS
jgi:hypothetical protein